MINMSEHRFTHLFPRQIKELKNMFFMEIWGIEPQTFHMQSERSTTELYLQSIKYSFRAKTKIPMYINMLDERKEMYMLKQD